MTVCAGRGPGTSQAKGNVLQAAKDTGGQRHGDAAQSTKGGVPLRCVCDSPGSGVPRDDTVGAAQVAGEGTAFATIFGGLVYAHLQTRLLVVCPPLAVAPAVGGQACSCFLQVLLIEGPLPSHQGHSGIRAPRLGREIYNDQTPDIKKNFIQKEHSYESYYC